jgi:hypothetical protein
MMMQNDRFLIDDAPFSSSHRNGGGKTEVRESRLYQSSLVQIERG